MISILAFTGVFFLGAFIGGYIGWVTGIYQADPFQDEHWENQDFDENGIRDERSGWERIKDWLNLKKGWKNDK